MTFGPATVRTHWASHELYRILGPSLAGICRSPPEPRTPNFDLWIWSGRDARPALTGLRRELERHPGTISVINHGAQHVHFNPEGGILSVVDCAAHVAFCYADEPAALPDYEVCTPIRAILNWICASTGLSFAHAAAVGTTDGGVLLIGRSGAGKSTTALTCYTRGLSLIGDDYVAIEHGESILAHALFRGCKLTQHGLARLPRMAPLVIETQRTGDKIVAIADASAGPLGASIPIRAILRPVVAHAAHSTLEPASPMDMVREFATSTILQMPGTGKQMLSALSALCLALPAYRLILSDDPDEVAAAVGAFLVNRSGVATS